jgi:hypothetical protein
MIFNRDSVIAFFGSQSIEWSIVSFLIQLRYSSSTTYQDEPRPEEKLSPILAIQKAK